MASQRSGDAPSPGSRGAAPPTCHRAIPHGRHDTAQPARPKAALFTTAACHDASSFAAVAVAAYRRAMPAESGVFRALHGRPASSLASVRLLLAKATKSHDNGFLNRLVTTGITTMLARHISAHCRLAAVALGARRALACFATHA